MANKYGAVVLAGGELYQKGKVHGQEKGALPFRGQSLASHAYSALTQIPEMDRIALVGNAQFDLRVSDIRVTSVAGRKNVYDSIKKGISALGRDNYIVIIPGDTPFIRSDSIRKIIEGCKKKDFDIYIPFVKYGDYLESEFAKRARSPVAFKEGKFIPAGVVVISPRLLQNKKIEAEVDRFAGLLKNNRVYGATFGLIRKLGIMNIIRLAHPKAPLFARFPIVKPHSISEIGPLLKKRLGINVEIGIHNTPDLCFDIDRPEHYALARRLSEKIS